MKHVTSARVRCREKKTFGGRRQKQARKPDFLVSAIFKPRPWGAHRLMPQPAAIPSPPPTSQPPAGTGSRTGVPVTIWPAIPPPAPCPGATSAPPCPNQIGAEPAARIITAFTRPGDLVVIPEARTSALVMAAATAGRRVLGLTASLPGHRDLAARLARGLGPARRPLADLRPGGPGLLLHATCGETGQATLAVTTACATPGCQPPGDGDDGAAGADPALVYAACQRVLRPGGLLAVVTSAVKEPGQPGEIIACARAAGLIYTQHIVALHAAIHASRLVPAPGGHLTLRPARGEAPAHLPIHSDILLFTAPGRPTP